MELGQEAIDLLDAIPNEVAKIGKRAQRVYVVIARDQYNTWRCREVRARTHAEAVGNYRAVFPTYEVLAVGMLGGSGFPLIWLREIDEPPVTPDWVPDGWLVTPLPT